MRKSVSHSVSYFSVPPRAYPSAAAAGSPSGSAAPGGLADSINNASEGVLRLYGCTHVRHDVRYGQLGGYRAGRARPRACRGTVPATRPRASGPLAQARRRTNETRSRRIRNPLSGSALPRRVGTGGDSMPHLRRKKTAHAARAAETRDASRNPITVPIEILSAMRNPV